MKKAITMAVALCACMALGMALVGCGGVDKSRYTGDWRLVDSTESGLDSDVLLLMDAMNVAVTLTLDDDGTGSMQLLESTDMDLTWEAQSNTEATGTLDGSDVAISLQDGKLVMAGQSDTVMTFARPDEAAEIMAAAREASSAGGTADAGAEASSSAAASDASSGAEEAEEPGE